MYLRPIGYLIAIALLASCGQGGQGQLVGAMNRPGYYQVDPYGMNYIPMGAYVMGLAFAFGWTPCIGPILSTVLAVAANEASLGAGVRLLAVYSMGLGIPFILAAVAIGPFMSFMQRFRRHLGLMEKIMGVLLILTGIAFLNVVDGFSIGAVGQWMIEHFPGLGRIEEWVTPKDLQGDILKQQPGQ